jgi:hypothetical protein
MELMWDMLLRGVQMLVVVVKMMVLIEAVLYEGACRIISIYLHTPRYIA